MGKKEIKNQKGEKIQKKNITKKKCLVESVIH